MYLQQARCLSTTFTEKAVVTNLRRRLPRFFDPETPVGFLKRKNGTTAAESKSVVASLPGQAHGMDCRVASATERKDLPPADRENAKQIPPFEFSHHTHLTPLNGLRPATYYCRQMHPHMSRSGNGRGDSFSVALRYGRVRFRKTHDERKGYMRFD